MQFLNGITLLLVYQLVGEVVVRLLDVPIPGPVLGMVMLFVTLAIRGATDRETSQGTGNFSMLHIVHAGGYQYTGGKQ